jgi:hypothetical protein
VWKDDKGGFIDKKGKLIVLIKYSYAAMFNEGLAVFSIRDLDADEPEWQTLMGVIDNKGRVIVKPIYDHIFN